MPAAAPSFDEANPHFMSAVVQAAETHRIVAARDIFDVRGIKLWARDLPVSPSLHQRLLDRKLREPIESCLRAEDGFTNVQLVERLDALLRSDHPLAAALRPQGAGIEQHARSLPLHAAVQLVLTAAAASRPGAIDHAVQGAALAAAMALAASLDRVGVRLAMLAGLLHDVGEMYVDPRYLDGSRQLDAADFRNVVVHPLMGAGLVQRFTDYPAALAAGIAEHHERLDQTGYPQRLGESTQGAIGRFVAVVETTLGIVNQGPLGLQKASLALRLVPGEYDRRWVGFVFRAALGQAAELPAEDPGEAAMRIALESTAIIGSVRDAAEAAAELCGDARASELVRELSGHVAHRLSRLDVAARSAGLGEPVPDIAAADVFEQSSALREIRYRLRGIARECLWAHPRLTQAEQEALAPLWARVS